MGNMQLVVQWLGCGAEDEQSEGSDHVATAGPPRQSSAINFNAALGKWALPARPNTAAGNLLPPAGSALSGAAPNAARQPRTGAQAQTEESSGVKVTHLLSGTMTYQQDLRPRSSDGILQRITVDRGPATGIFQCCNWCMEDRVSAMHNDTGVYRR